MNRETKLEIFKIIAMIAVLILLIYAMFLLNSKALDDKIENKIQAGIEGKIISEEEHVDKQESNDVQNETKQDDSGEKSENEKTETEAKEEQEEEKIENSDENN